MTSGECYEAVLDTSCILFAVDRGIDLVDMILRAQIPVCRIIIPSVVLKELRTLAEKGGGSRSAMASAALEVINRMLEREKGIVAVAYSDAQQSSVDMAVIALAREKTRLLVTADREMRKRAREMGVKAYLLSKASLKLL